jgi:energy-coupling factor transporter ATP-binding protein EcfA2
MPITPARFRRFEAAVLAVTEPEVAEMICQIIAAKMEGAPPESPPGSAGILIGDDGVDLDVFALQTGQSREAAYSQLFKAHMDAEAGLGFALFDAQSIRSQGRNLVRGTVIELSGYVRKLLAGNAFFEVPRQPTAGLKADTATRKWLDLVTTAAASEAGLRFLYRLSSAPESAGARFETGRVAADLKYRAGDKPVLIGESERNMSKTEFPLSLIALTAILHADRDAILILPFPAHWLKALPNVTSDDDEFQGPADERPAARQTIDPGAASFLRLLSQLDFTTILAMPGETVLEPETAALFAGALGPHHLDRASALADIKAQSPRGVLGARQAEKVLEAVSDPFHAKEILRAATAITNATGRKIVDFMKSSQPEKTSKAGVVTALFEKAPASKTIDMFELLYNQAVEDLAASLIPNVKRTGSLRAIPAASFDEDLFCSDPSPKFLFERARILREKGARILLAGPSGTGKSALVAHLARLMGLETKEHAGASLFARAWGQMEKNVAAAAAAGQGYLTFYDEADSLMGNRFTGSENNRHLTVAATSAFLAAYQDPEPGSPMIAATNRLDDIDPAIRRRFDVILTTKILPESKELLAWKRILNLFPPPGWAAVNGGTVPGDYVKAAHQLDLFGERDPIIAAASIVRARDERAVEGISKTKPRVGFV